MNLNKIEKNGSLTYEVPELEDDFTRNLYYLYYL